MAETLDYSHQKGVVHRDIKPSNIIVQPSNRIKITDFGIARIEDATASLQTRDGEIIGTPAYMSPQQVLGKTVDGRSDLFSLGVILYELCTGRRPYVSHSWDSPQLAPTWTPLSRVRSLAPARAPDWAESLAAWSIKATGGEGY